MVRYSKFIIVLFFSFSCIFAKGYPNKAVDALIKTGVNYVLNQNYSAAKEKFKMLEQQFPKLPFGKIYLAVTDIAESVDFGEKFNDDYVYKLLKDARHLSDSLYDSNEKDLWNNYFMALSDGYYAYFKGMNGDYLSAITNGISSISYYEKCIDIDTLFYDSYIALGTYYYWKSAKTKSLTWLPFISDDRELGQRLIEKSLYKETYSRFLGAYSLVWIYIERKEYQNAIRVCQDILSKYPNNRLFKQSLARIYVDVDKYRAIRLYSEVLNSIFSSGRNNHLLEIEIKHKIAMQYALLENYSKAKEYCDAILNIKNLSEYVEDQLGDRLDRVKKLRAEMVEKLKK